MTEKKLTAARVVIISLVTVAACLPGVFAYLVLSVLLIPLFGLFSLFVTFLVIGVPLLFVPAYLLKRFIKRRTESKRQRVGAYVICAIVFILGLPLIKINPPVFLSYSMSSMLLTFNIWRIGKREVAQK